MRACVGLLVIVTASVVAVVAQTTPPSCAPDLVTYTFRRGSLINNDSLPFVTYEGGHNTRLAENNANGIYYDQGSTFSDGGSGVRSQALFEWDGLLDVIPAGSYIESATISLVGLDSSSAASMYRMLQPWNETSTWNTFVGGVSGNGIEATSAIATLSSRSSDSAHTRTVSVTSTVREWISWNSGNFGVLIAQGGTNGRFWAGHSYNTQGWRPTLQVTWRQFTRAHRHSFQQGDADGYAGTVDTVIHSVLSTSDSSAATSLRIDGRTGSASGANAWISSLLRFDDTFGGNGPIPVGEPTTWVYATTLYVTTSDSAGNTVYLYRMATEWNDTMTYSTATLNGNTEAGIQPDGLEAVGGSIGTVASASSNGLTRSSSITSTGGWWMEGNANNGLWMYMSTNDGQSFHSSESSTQSFRPRLYVEWAECTAPCDEDAVPKTPTLQVNESVPDADNLNLVFYVPTDYVAGGGPDFVFTSATNATWCAAGWTVGTASVSADDAVCGTPHTYSQAGARTLRECGFSGPTADASGLYWLYESTIEATGVRKNNGTAVFGSNATRTERTSFAVQVAFPRNAAVDAGAAVFGPVLEQARVTTQTFDSLASEGTWTLATSVQWPYYLEYDAEGAASSTHAFDEAPAVGAGGECDGAGEGEGAACTQTFAVSAAETQDCVIDGTITVPFLLRCRAAFTGSCDLPSPSTTSVSFPVRTDNICAEVVEVASVTPVLTVYATPEARTAGTPQSADFVLETPAYFRMSFETEAGVAVSNVRLTDVRVDSDCGPAGCARPSMSPMSGGEVALNAETLYGFAYEVGGHTGGEQLHDFQFRLDDDTVAFGDTNAALVTVVATVAVEYAVAGSQATRRAEFAVSTDARSLALSAAAGLETTRSDVESGGDTSSSSSSSSAVPGSLLSGGTIAAAGAALAVLVAVAAVVAVRRRRRGSGGSTAGAAAKSLRARRAAAAKSTAAVPSSSSSALAACGPTPSAVVEVSNLADVRDVYEQTAAI